MARQQLRHFRAHVQDAQGEQDARQGTLLAGLNVGQDARRQLVAHPVQLRQLFPRQPVQMRRIGHQPPVNQNLAPPFAQPVDVHCAPADEMLQRFKELRRAGPVGAAVHGVPFYFDDGGVAVLAAFRHPKLRPPFLSGNRHRPDDIGNDIAGPLNDHQIADPNILAVNVLLIVQRGVLHRSPADHHRLQNRLRVQAAGAPHADDDVPQPGCGPFRRKLVGNGPARFPPGKAQRVLLRDAVHLDHQPVGFITPLVPPRQHFIIVGADFINGVKDAILRIDLKPPAIQRGQGVPVTGRQRLIVCIVEAVRPDFHIAAAGHFRVQLADGAGAGVAGVGVEGLAVAFPFLVQFSETRQGQIDFAPRLQAGRRPRRQRVGNAGHRPQVVGNILARMPVAPRGAQNQPSVGIHQPHRQPVNLKLRHHAKRPPVQQVGHPAMPRFQSFPVKGVAQAQHRRRMLNLRKSVGGAAAHPLGRRIGDAAFRVIRFQGAQFRHQVVILAVADDGGVLVVVLRVVEPDFVAQLAGAFYRVDGGSRRRGSGCGGQCSHPCHPARG